jgi:predicted amidohydrolase
MARQTLHNSGETIHFALWPKVHEMHQVCSRQYAFEVRTFVVAVGQIAQAKDLPKSLDYPNSIKNNPDKYILDGGSAIIAPNGMYEREPTLEKESLIVHKIENLQRTIEESMTLDTSGHYQRPDIFNLEVTKKRI